MSADVCEIHVYILCLQMCVRYYMRYVYTCVYIYMYILCVYIYMYILCVYIYMYILCIYLSADVCEMLEKEKQQLQDWEARHAFVEEFSSSVKVR